MELDRLLTSRRKSRAKSGLVVSSRAAVGVAAIIVILLALSFLNLSSTLSKTTTTTKFITGIPATLLNLTDTFSGSNAEQIYAYANQSIVTLQGVQTQNGQQVGILGSGFVIAYSNSYYIITNYHVAGGTSSFTVTFSDGDSYPANVVGSDPYSDLAVVDAPQAPVKEYHPLPIVSSSSLAVGQTVLAIGNPFGLSASITSGIISQLGRTIQDPTAGNFSIADAIQFSAPINPGNSGGVLLNSNGSVIGVPTASITGSQGVGFAIPSDTIIRELPSLVVNGTYTKHSYVGIEATDMNYELAQDIGTNYTYGVLIESTVPGGPAANAGLRGGSNTVIIEGQQYLIGGDIIVSVNGTKIINNDALATFLEEHTLAGEKVAFGIIRSGTYMVVNVTLGQRPPI